MLCTGTGVTINYNIITAALLVPTILPSPPCIVLEMVALQHCTDRRRTICYFIKWLQLSFCRN